ncbi:sialidase family protein [Oleiharenicola lentus]|uniref:sialidase family protein n=1 Tax=Oleiharenicola lentus TaxID=2508720 RepID=UPI003F67D986
MILRHAALILLTCLASNLVPAAEPPPVKKTAPKVKTELLGKAVPLRFDLMGPFINLPDGGVLAVDGNATRTSHDDGQTWSNPVPLFPAEANLELRPERALVSTKQNTLVLVFIDNKDRVWQWVKDDPNVLQKNTLNVWAVRSVDGGKTWIDLQMIQRGYCGAIRDMIVAADGRIIVTSQLLLPAVARHATVTHVSVDEGRTWRISNVLDVLDTPGDHSGGFEPTVIEQTDHRFRLLIRTNRKVFWQAWSTDGLDWTGLEPSPIEAAHAPGLIKRLQSGRQVLVWNAIFGNRKLIHIAFSDDDGKTWGAPVPLARGARISYPYLLERRPGELWITSMQGALRAVAHEADFTKESSVARVKSLP